MYQDDPEVKVALIRAAETLAIQPDETEGNRGIDRDTRDTAREYLRELMSLSDDAEPGEPPEEEIDGEPLN